MYRQGDILILKLDQTELKVAKEMLYEALGNHEDYATAKEHLKEAREEMKKAKYDAMAVTEECKVKKVNNNV